MDIQMSFAGVIDNSLSQQSALNVVLPGNLIVAGSEANVKTLNATSIELSDPSGPFTTLTAVDVGVVGGGEYALNVSDGLAVTQSVKVGQDVELGDSTTPEVIPRTFRVWDGSTATELQYGLLQSADLSVPGPNNKSTTVIAGFSGLPSLNSAFLGVALDVGPSSLAPWSSSGAYVAGNQVAYGSNSFNQLVWTAVTPVTATPPAYPAWTPSAGGFVGVNGRMSITGDVSMCGGITLSGYSGEPPNVVGGDQGISATGTTLFSIPISPQALQFTKIAVTMALMTANTDAGNNYSMYLAAGGTVGGVPAYEPLCSFYEIPQATSAINFSTATLIGNGVLIKGVHYDSTSTTINFQAVANGSYPATAVHQWHANGTITPGF